jgi:putative transposase
MPPVVSALLAFLAACFRSRRALWLEILALRYQLAVYQRSVPSPCIQAERSAVLVVARLLVVRMAGRARFCPASHRRGLATETVRENWRRLSQRGKPGRPTIAKDVRDLIRAMWQANPTCGAPRIVGE